MSSLMTKEEIKRVLRSRPIARLATADKKCQPHVVPVVLISDGDSIFIHTAKDAKKAKNVMANPKVSLVVDYFLQTSRLEVGFVIDGTAKRINKPEEMEKVVRKMMRSGSEGRAIHPDIQRPTQFSAEFNTEGREPMVNLALFEIRVKKISSWKRSELALIWAHNEQKCQVTHVKRWYQDSSDMCSFS